MKRRNIGKIRRTFIGILTLWMLLSSLSACEKENAPENTEPQETKEIHTAESTDAVFETGDPGEIVFPGDEAEEAPVYAEKTHKPEEVLTNYENIFYVTSPYGAYIRETPNSASKILGALPEAGGGNILSQSTSTTWYRVNSGTVTGYISAGSVLTGTEAEKYAKAKAEERVKLLEDTDVYSDAEGTQRLSSVKTGEVYDLLGETEMFYRIRLTEAQEGFLPKETAKQSLFLSESREEALNGITICINPLFTSTEGEGEDPLSPDSSETVARFSAGAVGAESGVPEYSVNLSFARTVAKELRNRGYRVFLTRDSNRTELGRTDMARYANDTGAELVLHLCCGSSEDERVTGAYVYYPPKSVSETISSASRTFAEVLSGKLEKASGDSGYGNSSRFPELNFSETTSVLLRLGYLTTPEEDRKLNEETYRTKIAEGIADAVDRYYGIGH